MVRTFTLFVLLISALAQASVSDPFPGVRLVRNGGSSMLVVSLCTPGVSVRATKYGERRGTPQTWAQRVGAQAAINADFFDFPGWSLVNGRARGGGEDWPGDKQFFESRSYWHFGLFVAGLQEDANVPPAGAPWMTDIVGGHNVLIRNGQSQGPNFDGDAVLNGAYRRTAIGISADRRTLFLLASGKLLTGSALAAELLALAAEAGGPGIDLATNMDGGGSSQMYVEGQGQIVTSGREVNNHLGIFAGGTGFPANCNNLPPRGNIDSLTCDGVAGWAQDPTHPDRPISVRVEVDGADTLTFVADQHRDDLCTNLMSCVHGFTTPLPRVLLDGKPHQVRVLGLDTENASAWSLSEQPKTLTCNVEPPPGQLRHVINPESFAAWRFSFAADVQSVSPATLHARVEAADWPATPELIRGEGRPEVYLVDGQTRRHVAAAVVAAWRFDLASVRVVPVTALADFTEGPPLGLPWLVRAEGEPAIYALDSAPFASLSPTALGLAEAPGRPASTAPSNPETVVGGCSSTAMSMTLLALAALIRRRRRRSETSHRRRDSVSVPHRVMARRTSAADTR